LFVVVWEPTEGFGGGCQSVSDQRQAEQIAASLQRQRPDCMVRVMPAAEYGASAVVERQRLWSTNRQPR